MGMNKTFYLSTKWKRLENILLILLMLSHKSTDTRAHLVQVVLGVTDPNFTRLLRRDCPTMRTNSKNCFMNIRANKIC